MRKLITICAVIVCVMVVVNVASADIIRGINMDFVTIGNAGNAGDTRMYLSNPYGCGAVSYDYRIGKYEVTNTQWNAFISAAGAPTGNDGGYNSSSYWTGAQQPTTDVSWYEAAQFCNYLTSGDKSKGAYLFSGNKTNPGNFLGINRNAAISSYGVAYVIPTVDEWYKAAYFKPDGSGYSSYATGDRAPGYGVGGSNYGGAIEATWNVGSGTQEQNGTFDMMGNVWEWNETLVNNSYRYFRGGFYGSESSGGSLMVSSWCYSGNPAGEGDSLGFRVASVVVPEPATLLLLGLGAVILRRKR